METLKVKFRGIAPLLMNSNVGVNPLHPLSIETKKLTSKRTKTEEDHLAILDLKYRLAMYYEKEIGPYIPAICVEATLRNAAKKIKKGTAVKEALFVEPDFIPLEYDGPRDIEELITDMRFRDVRVGCIERSSIIICRPRFDHWAIEFAISYDAAMFDLETIKNILDIAGRYIGICDYRPRYGKFIAEIL